MNAILVPICDPGDASWAAHQAIALYRAEPARIHLINVQRPLPKHISQFFNRNELQDFHHEAGMRVLGPAAGMLDQAHIPHYDHVLVGHQAETIVRFAQEHGCGQIVVDAPPKTMLSKLGLGSIGSQVMHLMQARAADAPASGASSVN
jgi:xanthine/CO dehydrogenase XdhC/CoxF family maturation factor